MDSPEKIKNKFQNARFHHVSTDEVYGSLGSLGFFQEDTPYAPNSPYSASKASSDFIIRSYFHTYGLNITISNCSNNFGPNQHDEKLIPTIIRNALQHNSIPIYGNGLNIRDWLFVIDHCEAIDIIFSIGEDGESYNIGSNNEFTNIALLKLICSILDDIHPSPSLNSYLELISFVQDRAGHDQRYAIDASKIKNDLNWISRTDFNKSLTLSIKHYLSKYLTKAV
jgi:dTDP-glucose 4,6-dehydratase